MLKEKCIQNPAPQQIWFFQFNVSFAILVPMYLSYV